MSKCKHLGVDGICTKSKGDEVTEFCREGPCEFEMRGSDKAIEIMSDHQKYMKGDPNEWVYDLAITALRNQSESKLAQTTKALELVCTEAACDDCCPYDSEPDFEGFPECETCIVNNPTGEMIFHDTDRDLACWIRHYMRKAEVTGHDQKE